MRSIRIALSCLASALALIALSAGAALAADPQEDTTISLAGITLGSDDKTLDVELDVDLGLEVDLGPDTTAGANEPDIAADARLDAELGHARDAEASALDAEVDARVDLHVGDIRGSAADGGHAPVVDADADVDTDATVEVGGRNHDGVAALVRVPALLDVTVLDVVDVTALADVCIALGLFTDAPACRVSAGAEAPAGTEGNGLTAVVDAAATAVAQAGEDVAADAAADACVGVGIGAAAPTCGGAGVTPDDGSTETPSERAPDRIGDGGVAPDEAVAEPGDRGAAPATARGSGDAPTPSGQLPDTALGGPTDIGLWILVAAVLAGLALGHRRARSGAR